MTKLLVPDKLWERIGPLLPRRRRSRKGGRPAVPDRDALRGIVFVLRTGIQWQMLPQELGCGCGMTCWRRLRDWQRAGVWQAVHRELLYELGAAGKIDWSRAALDGSNVAAKGGAAKRSARTRPIGASRAASTTCS